MDSTQIPFILHDFTYMHTKYQSHYHSYLGKYIIIIDVNVMVIFDSAQLFKSMATE